MDIAAFKANYADLIAETKAAVTRDLRPVCPLLPTDGAPGLLDSRFGGPIAWPAAEPTPQDADGQPMIFALQINLGMASPPPGFPQLGLLQLFLANDLATRGITFMQEYRAPGDFPLQNGDGFRLVYHPVTEALTAHDYALPGVEYPIFFDGLVTTPRVLTVAPPETQSLPPTHWQSLPLWQRFEALPEYDADPVAVADFLMDEVWSTRQPPAPHLGGYAQPLQNDHRFFFKEYRRYSQCVLQLGPLPGIDFGDMAVALLITPEHLAAADFGDVIAIGDAD